MKLWVANIFLFLILSLANPAKSEDNFNLNEIESEIIRTQIAIHVDFLGELKAPFVCLKVNGNDPSDEMLETLHDSIIPVRKISECVSPAIEIWLHNTTIVGDSAFATSGLNIEDKPISLAQYMLIKENEKNIRIRIKQMWFIERNKPAPKQSI